MRRALNAGFAVLLAAGPAFAQERMAGEGEVVTLNPDMNAFSLRRAESGDAPDVRILTDNRTLFSGIRALEDLHLGERVVVSADLNDRTGTWGARSVAVSPRQVPPPETREDVITDEVIRNDRSSLAPIAGPAEAPPSASEPFEAPATETTAEPVPEPVAAEPDAADEPVATSPPEAAPEASVPAAPAGDTPLMSREESPIPEGDSPAPTVDEPTDQNRTPH